LSFVGWAEGSDAQQNPLGFTQALIFPTAPRLQMICAGGSQNCCVRPRCKRDHERAHREKVRPPFQLLAHLDGRATTLRVPRSWAC